MNIQKRAKEACGAHSAIGKCPQFGVASYAIPNTSKFLKYWAKNSPLTTYEATCL